MSANWHDTPKTIPRAPSRVAMRAGAGLLGAALALGAVTLPAQAEKASWAPYPVEVWTDAFNMEGPRAEVDYVPLDAASKPWSLCVSLPHMKDSYWLAVDFGLIDEVERLGVKARIKTAGGYGNLDTQREQIESCLAEDTDALIIGAISSDGLNDLVAKAAAQDMPVIDLVNGMSAEDLSAKSLVSFGEMGRKAGDYIVDKATKGDARIAWFPGPEGAGWVAAGDAAFKEAVAAGAPEVVTTKHGDTTPAAQKALVTEVLDSRDDIAIIAGTAVTADVATEVLEERGLDDKVQVVSYYLTPSIYRHIRRGRVAASPTDSPVIQARIAVDQAVRLLEGKDVKRHVGPKIIVLDRSTINFFDYLSALPPRSFEPVMTVGE